MIKVVIAATRSNDPEVHAAGCADVTRGLKSGKYQGTHEIEVETVEKAAEWFWVDIIEEGGMDAEDAQAYTKYLPCTNRL